MKPEPPPENSLVPETGDVEDDFEAIGKQVGLELDAPAENTGNPYDNSADGFHGRALQEKSTNDDDEEGGGTFMTDLKDGVGTKKMLSREDEDLGIYEDTDVNGDEDVSDTELELERLREEKRKRELEEKDRLRAEEKLRQQAEEAKRQAENVRSLTDSAIKQIEKQMITPRTDISMDSRISSKSWSDPRFLQGISIRDIHWKTECGIVPITSMKAEILQSR